MAISLTSLAISICLLILRRYLVSHMRFAALSLFASFLAIVGLPVASHENREGLEEAYGVGYNFGYEWGGVTAGCIHFELGSLPKQSAIDSINRIKETKDLSYEQKRDIFKKLKSMELAKCAALIQELGY